MIRRPVATLAAGALALGGSAWVASAASASPSVEHDAINVVGAGTSVVETLDENGNANQSTVDAADSNTAENDSNAQEHDANLQEGNSGTNEDGTANDLADHDSQTQTQTGESGDHGTSTNDNHGDTITSAPSGGSSTTNG